MSAIDWTTLPALEKLDQAKVDSLWSYVAGKVPEQHVKELTLFCLAIIPQEGTGSCDTSSTNKAADGGNGIELVWGTDVQRAGDLVVVSSSCTSRRSTRGLSRRLRRFSRQQTDVPPMAPRISGSTGGRPWCAGTAPSRAAPAMPSMGPGGPALDRTTSRSAAPWRRSLTVATIRVTVNGLPVELKARLEEGTTRGDLRPLAEALGATVTWIPPERGGPVVEIKNRLPS